MPGKLDSDLLVRTLVKNRQFVSFFNERLQTAAAQYFGTQGIFVTYDAKLDEPLTEAVKSVWEQKFDEASKRAKAVAKAEKAGAKPTRQKRGEVLKTIFEQQSRASLSK